ncbi:chemotaxis protein CheA [Thiomicrorhabdus sp.]|uniref:chemotaxis protein CheA n=1 Tax=Thiomicrorhabdus sp. TaxID=2039724 RepID=UPI0035633219
MDISLAQRLFLEEAEDLLQDIADSLTSIKDSPKQAKTYINQIFRSVHTIKGSCRALGHENLADFADEFESFLQFSRQSTGPLSSEHITLLSQLHEHLELLIKKINFQDLLIDLDHQKHLLNKIDYLKNNAKENTDSEERKLTLNSSETEKIISTAETVKLDNSSINKLQQEITAIQLILERHRQALLQKESSLVEETLDQLEKKVGNLQYQTSQINQISINTLLERLKFTFDDACRAADKKAELSIYTNTESIDRSLADKLYEPLMHLIRNAVDHGIDSLTERQANGKPEIAQISCTFTQQLGQLNIEIKDDGPGLNLSKIKEKAVNTQLVQPLDQMSDQQLQQLVFLPGFTTHNSPSQLSGRGVGLDYVRNYLLQLRGNIRLTSIPGNGTTFTLNLPLKSSEQSTLLVRIGQTIFGIDTQIVHECIAMHGKVDERNYVLLPIYQQRPRVIDLYKLLNLSKQDAQNINKHSSSIVFIQYDGEFFALIADEILRTQVLRVEPRACFIGSQNCFNGTSLLENGETAYSLDMFSIREKLE